MIVGCLGEIVFTVSADVVRTLSDMEWSGKARWAVHERHQSNALTEFTGLEPDEFTFDLTLSAFLGTNPMDDMVRLWTYERTGTPVPLVIGDHAYGKWLWSVVSHTSKYEATAPDGSVTYAKVSVSLMEYLKK